MLDHTHEGGKFLFFIFLTIGVTIILTVNIIIIIAVRDIIQRSFLMITAIIFNLWGFAYSKQISFYTKFVCKIDK